MSKETAIKQLRVSQFWFPSIIGRTEKRGHLFVEAHYVSSSLFATANDGFRHSMSTFVYRVCPVPYLMDLAHQKGVRVKNLTDLMIKAVEEKETLPFRLAEKTTPFRSKTLGDKVYQLLTFEPGTMASTWTSVPELKGLTELPLDLSLEQASAISDLHMTLRDKYGYFPGYISDIEDMVQKL